MGTPGFAVASLEKLVAGGYNVVAVVTVPDKPAGRGQQVQQSEVKQFAVQHDIPVLQPEKLKSPEFLEALKALRADLQIVVAFRMLPEAVWQMPPMGTFNLHGSLLPHYRGAAPINRAVMNGETKTGVTTFFLQHEIDTGNIIFREETPIGPDETAGDVHDRLMHIGATLVVKTVDAIASGSYPQVPQSTLLAPGEPVKTAPKIFRDDCRIDWKQHGKKIHDHVRGLSPYPGAWTMLHVADPAVAPVPVKIFRTRFLAEDDAANKNSEEKFPLIKVEGGFLRVEELQVPGKKRMKSEEFLRGFMMGGIFLV